VLNTDLQGGPKEKATNKLSKIILYCIEVLRNVNDLKQQLKTRLL